MVHLSDTGSRPRKLIAIPNDEMGGVIERASGKIQELEAASA
jgi:hypothetical protein